MKEYPPSDCSDTITANDQLLRDQLEQTFKRCFWFLWSWKAYQKTQSPCSNPSKSCDSSTAFPMFSATSQPEASSFLLGPGPPIVTGDSERGPPGCNLFVFHLPNELTNWDLYLLFRKFGTIVSVHTMINKNTGLSRGFGFVSFSKEDEAIAAVRSMDGFRVRNNMLVNSTFFYDDVCNTPRSSERRD